MKNRKHVKKVAIRLVRKDGLINLSRWYLCAVANVPEGSFASIMECSFTEFVEELRAGNHPDGGKDPERSRVFANLRREQIIDKALDLSVEIGYDKITRARVAEAAGVSGRLIYHHFGDITELKKVILRVAVDRECLSVIAQGVVNKAPAALAAPRRLRLKAVRSVMGE